MKKKMLLHSCCAPCSTHVIDCLKDDYDLTIFYYNPNIYPKEEYLHRLNEQKRYCAMIGIPVTEPEYNESEFLSQVKERERDKEGGGRCSICFLLRLQKTASRAKADSFDIFATTLTVSPYKNSETINTIGKELEKEFEIEFYEGNFKKKEGYKHSIELSKRHNLYRQHYCGCRFSVPKQEI